MARRPPRPPVRVMPDPGDITRVREDIVRDHQQADAACGRAWVCACGACRIARAIVAPHTNSDAATWCPDCRGGFKDLDRGIVCATCRGVGYIGGAQTIPRPNRAPRVFSVGVYLRVTPEQEKRWKAAAAEAAKLEPRGKGLSFQEWARRELDQAADFALREKP